MKKLKSHKSFGGFTEFYEHESKTTSTTMKFSIYRPPETHSVRGGLIWLSGLTCNEENFITKAGAQQFLSQHGIAVICPDTSPRGLDLAGEHESYDFGSGAGFYVDATTKGYKDHYKMFTYINKEVYELFDKMFSLQGNVGIFGHSMGGHGALVSGLRLPKQYRSVSAFSPIVNPVAAPWGKKAFRGYLGEDSSLWAEYDACELLKAGNRHPESILIDQGLADDFLAEQLLTENFKKVAGEKSQQAQVRMSEGYDHSYYFISSFMESHIEHHSRILSRRTQE